MKSSGGGCPCEVVILTTFARAGYLRRALDAESPDTFLRMHRPRLSPMRFAGSAREHASSTPNWRPKLEKPIR